MVTKREYPGILMPQWYSITKKGAERKAKHYRSLGFSVRIEKLANQNDPSGFHYQLKIWGGGTKRRKK